MIESAKLSEWCDKFGFSKEDIGFNPAKMEYQLKDLKTDKIYHVPISIIDVMKDVRPKEMVDHPDHYNLPGRKECIDEMVDIYGLSSTCVWCLETAYKYCYRAGEKDGNSKEQDYAKIKWYLNWCYKNINHVEPSNLSIIKTMYYKTIAKIGEATAGEIFKDGGLEV